MYSLLLKNGILVDPVSGTRQKMDIAVEDGKISALGNDLDPKDALVTLELEGKVVAPGIIDPHVHLTERLGGHEGFYMLAKAGVTTAVDFAGPVSEIRECFQEEACGLNIACLEAIIPGDNLSGSNPSTSELEEVVQKSLNDGGLGIKIMGGHYPLTPGATKRAIEVANQKKAYIAFHAGTTTKGSNLEGALQALELIGSNSAHLAHINSYCRGAIKTPLEEVLELHEQLKHRKNIVSGSYLAMVNGTSGKCVEGKPESNVTRRCLETGGYSQTSQGLEKAILDGFPGVSVKRGRANILLYGQEARDIWLQDDNVPLSFPVNSPEAILLCAISKREDHSFIVPAFVSDGGAIARNCIVEKGLTLVKMKYLTIEEFIIKTSLNPARMFGFTTKGSLKEGMDADITVLDLDACKAITGIANGRIIMMEGRVTGSGGTLLTTTEVSDIHRQKKDFRKIDMAQSLLYRGK